MKSPLLDFSIEKALKFANQNYDQVIYLTSNTKEGKDILAFGVQTEFEQTNVLDFSQFQNYLDETKSWKFGYFSYDVKNSIENLTSENSDNLNFPLAYFFSPKHLFIKEESSWILNSTDESIVNEIETFSEQKTIKVSKTQMQFEDKVSKREYIEKVNLAKHHIKQGDVYELNFCYEKYASGININPVGTFLSINEKAQAPFSSFFKLNDKYALCFSPERYIKKEGEKLISQPIKGTAPRGVNLKEDEKLKEALRNDKKEQNENVMIVDLVRNDLSRTAAKNSVKVDELFGIYSFNTVHQMISTISSEIKEGVSVADIFKTTFPMGSMTGAPKIRAMQIIEELESTKRGLYSGAIGYITPNQDFDFNVVIRTLLYNSTQQYLSLMVGSAITDACQPEKEYEETLLKAQKIIDHFN